MTIPPFWTEHIFVMLCPDSVLRGVQRRLVDRVRAEGFTPVAARLVWCNSDLIDEMYSDLIAGEWQTWRYRLIDDALGLGPSIVMVCRYDGAADDPHQLIARRKGNQHPHRAEAGTIRSDFGAINSILGLVHASDAPSEARHDATVFGLVGTELDGGDPDCVRRLDYLCRLTARHDPERRDFEAVLAGLRTRVLAPWWERLGRSAAEAVAADFSIIDDFGAADAGKRLTSILDGSLPDLELELLGHEFTPEWRGDRRAADVFASYRRAGVELDAWESVVLESSMYFPPARRSIRDSV
jgi:nucleoside diphosphate kinase